MGLESPEPAPTNVGSGADRQFGIREPRTRSPTRGPSIRNHTSNSGTWPRARRFGSRPQRPAAARVWRFGVREPAVAPGAPNLWREKRTPKKTMCECIAGLCLILLLHQIQNQKKQKWWSNLVDPASSYMLVSKTKPYGETTNSSLLPGFQKEMRKEKKKKTKGRQQRSEEEPPTKRTSRQAELRIKRKEWKNKKKKEQELSKSKQQTLLPRP